MSSASVTRVVLLTPTGRGAIATLLVRGPGALAAVSCYFLPAVGQPLDAEPIGLMFNRPRYGRWNGPSGEELIVCLLDAERVEIHCHGGVAAAEAIQSALVAAGCRRADALDSELLSNPDPIGRAATRALLQASTERCAAILLDQLAGALRREIITIQAAIAAGDVVGAARLLEALLATAHVGLHLVEPFRVVLVGAPNAGKSSLINRLMGFDRSIVHNEPGTTRDLVTATTAIDGWPVELIDTAGLHATTDVLELAGMARAQAQAASADLVVLVIDRGRVRDEFDWNAYPNWKSVLLVENKCDLPATVASSKLPAECRTSAATGEGIAELIATMALRLVPSPPEPGAAVLFTHAQVRELEAADEQLRSSDVRGAANTLSNLLANEPDSDARD